MNKFKPSVFYSEVKDELKKVNWPTRDQTIGTTLVVLVVVFIITLYLGVLDAGLARIAAKVIG